MNFVFSSVRRCAVLVIVPALVFTATYLLFPNALQAQEFTPEMLKAASQ